MTQVTSTARTSIKYIKYLAAIIVGASLVFLGYSSGDKGSSSLFTQKVFAGHQNNCWCGGSPLDLYEGDSAFFARKAYGDGDGDGDGDYSGGSSGCYCDNPWDGDGDDGADGGDGGCP